MMSSHNRVHYVKQDQPAFLKKFKQKVGMKQEATVEDKTQDVPDDCDDNEKDDEKPVVVVLNEGDLTAEQAAAHEDVTSEPHAGKIVFKKPTKRNSDCGLSASTKKAKKDTNTSTKKPKKKEEDSSKTKCATSSSLLSFEYDD